jgi:hypothetical protein
MNLAPNTKLDLREFPKVGTSVLSWIGKLIGSPQHELPLTELPVFKSLVRGVPPSILVEPDAAQMRLPYVLEMTD